MHPRIRSTIAVLAVVAVAAAAAGCGGSGHRSSHTTPRVVANSAPVSASTTAGNAGGASDGHTAAPPSRSLVATMAQQESGVRTCQAPDSDHPLEPLGHLCAVSGTEENDSSNQWSFVNDTPYTLTLYPQFTAAQILSPSGSWDGSDVQQDEIPGHSDWAFVRWTGQAPPQTVAPGQEVWMTESSACWGSDWVSYTYKADGPGGDDYTHMATFGFHLNTSSPSCWHDIAVDGYTDWLFDNPNSSTPGRWEADDGSVAAREAHVQPAVVRKTGDAQLALVLSDPKPVVIDAKANPNAAVTAVAHLNDTDRISDESFTQVGPETSTPASQAPSQPATPTLINTSDHSASIGGGTYITDSQSTSISQSLSVEASGGVFAAVIAGVSLDSGQSWETSTDKLDETDTTVDGGTQGCLVKRVATINVTGTLKFKWWGIPFVINNATFSTPVAGSDDTVGVHANFPDNGKDPGTGKPQAPFPCVTTDASTPAPPTTPPTTAPTQNDK